MKRVISDILHTPCQTLDITDAERSVFASYKHLQRYHPGLDQFQADFDNDSYTQEASFPLRFRLTQWESTDNENMYKCLRNDILSPDISDTEVNVFVKKIHLLDPIAVLRKEYISPEHPLLPRGEKAWRTTLQKIHSPNNQAYIDTIANHILSRFRELNLTPHCTLSYGSLCGIADNYKFRISDDFGSYRHCKWFWRGLHSSGARLKICKDDRDISEVEEFKELYDTYFKPPESLDDGSSISELSSNENMNLIDINIDMQSVKSFSFDTDNLPTLITTDSNPSMFQSSDSDTAGGSGEASPIHIGMNLEMSDNSDASTDEEDDDDDDIDSDADSELSIDISLEIPNMPVIMVYQECHEGTMDSLLELDEIHGYKRGTKMWEKVWIAWLWQVVAVLGFLQKSICFTHNDLHTNNVLWRSTTDEFLYYKSKSGTVWRVPTYGKIFSLIDFGRAIFRIGKKLWISDDHWPNNDAGGQYNFGPIRNLFEPKVSPNPSFDLCRLSVSMLDGLFEDIPDKRKGRNVPILSKDGSWVIHETTSQLFNLLYSWTIDDSGKTIYETQNGGERYPGFELYIRIARDIHNAIPREQCKKPIFSIFEYSGKIPDGKTVYSIGC
jgi:hypothetical protein